MHYLNELKSVILFDNMSETEIYKVLRCLDAQVKIYKKDEYIYAQGDLFNKIGIIIEGNIKIIKEWQDGAYTIIGNLKKEDTFGEDIICSGSDKCPHSIISCDDTKIIYIDGVKLVNPNSTVCKYRSKVNLNMLKRMAEYSVFINMKSEYSRIMSLRKRVGTFLFDYYKKKNSLIFEIEMNREEMSSYLNATRPAVSKVLMYYKKNEILDYKKNKFEILDEKKLLKEII